LVSLTLVGIAAFVAFLPLVALANPGASAVFQVLDTTTQGSWKGHYGADGSLIANDPSSHPPAYAAISTNAAQFTWADPSIDPRSLLKGASASDRIASTFYSNSAFSFDVNLTDGQTHEVALYLLDLDTTTRNETISILDAASNVVLDSRPLANFHNGLYA